MQERLLAVIRHFPERHITIVGDAIADRFLHGIISRVSREAPVFILRHDHTETVPGGAANCAMNLASLGASVSLISVAGNDEAGQALRARLQGRGIDTSGFLLSDEYQTPTKMRILAGQSHSTRQQVIRVDYEADNPSDPQLRSSLADRLRELLSTTDGLVISDYNYGTVDGGLVNLIRESTAARKIPVLVDSRFRLGDFSGFTSATPNEDEVEHIVGVPIVSQSQLEEAAVRLKQLLGYQALLVTRGSQGMMLLENQESPLHIEAVGALEPVDVTGAGDTVIATFALGLACDASFSDAARLANYAGGLVVMKRGTASVTASELEASLLSDV
ncbi:MAG TPA: PfkB family carbohydrate kinase [Pyrinomonadaceae bacterium]|nr:PfkB family carbohydrate kinase [Pyrinomonadaceae bacterium]